jgi:hypothetical protein
MQPPTKCCAGAALAYASAMVCREVTCLPAARAGAASEVAAISVIAKAFSWAICFSPYVREADKGLASRRLGMSNSSLATLKCGRMPLMLPGIEDMLGHLKENG